MKLRHLITNSLAICGLVTGCLSEPEFEPVADDGGIPINLDGSISQITTKANAQGFEDKDAIGLYAVNYEDFNQTPGILKDEGNQADHVKYIFDQTSWKWNPVRPVYYKDINTNVDLYAFYPYAEPASASAYTFEVQKDQSTTETASRLAGYEASDFLWAKATGIAPSESAIRMTLTHRMAGAHVVLTEGTGFEEAGDFDLIDKKVLVTNTTRKATINLADGSVASVGDAQATGIVMCPQTDGSFRAVIVPQSVDAGMQLFSITIEGVAYGFSKDVPVEYVSGKLNTFTITVNRKQPSGEYELVLTDSYIADWTEDLNTHEGEARQYYCVNVSEPGTLGKLIKADNKNPMKIRNLKVSGTISDEDFYFMRDSMAILEAVNLKESRIVDVECTELTIPGHNDEYGNPTIFATREAGSYDDVIPDRSFYNKRTLYHFTFPETITDIGEFAFCGSSITGTLTIPDCTRHIWDSAFENTNITNLLLPPQLEIISRRSFYVCYSLSGRISIPETVQYIGSLAFRDCRFSSSLTLPESLTYIGGEAFWRCNFVGGLTIPSGIPALYGSTFSYAGFTGRLDLGNVQKMNSGEFEHCGFQGELIIPEGIIEIPYFAFEGTELSSVKLPSTLKIINERAFAYSSRLTNINFPEGLFNIGAQAFWYCDNLSSIQLPSTIHTINTYAFGECHDINSIICHSIEPPIIQAGAFDGVAKDNVTVEVPENAVNSYVVDPEWGKFRRISAHCEFSVNRKRARTLNDETSKTYILRAPANHNWSIESKPDWITVTPSSGTGKTEVTVTFAEMTSADASEISVEITDPTYAHQTTSRKLNGRSGEIIFLLDDKDYRTTMAVEQFDYQHGDGDVITLNEATKGDGVDIVFLADCYDAADVAAGNYLADIKEAAEHYFALEPYRTYKDYFNVYAVLGVSDDSGMGTVNTIKDAKFGSTFGEKKLVQPDMNTCFEYACKAPIDNNIAQTLIVLVENTTEYGGITYMYGDGTAIACCPKSADAYPYDFRGIVQHEAGGHGFGKLADEYIYHNEFISTCGCTDGCGHISAFNGGKANGWYRNLELTSDMNEVGWSHFIFHPKYSNVVDIYEGGYFHTRGVYRSEPTSCMNNNIPYYSAISRQAIVERIMKYAGEAFELDKFIANDVTTAGPTTKAGPCIMPVETFYNNGKQYAPVYMGDKPDFRK